MSSPRPVSLERIKRAREALQRANAFYYHDASDGMLSTSWTGTETHFTRHTEFVLFQVCVVGTPFLLADLVEIRVGQHTAVEIGGERWNQWHDVDRIVPRGASVFAARRTPTRAVHDPPAVVIGWHTMTADGGAFRPELTELQRALLEVAKENSVTPGDLEKLEQLSAGERVQVLRELGARLRRWSPFAADELEAYRED